MIGFVFVRIHTGRDKEFMTAIQGFDEVVEANLTTGEYDALLVVHGRDEQDIVKFNLQKLRVLRDVEDSYVCLSVAAVKA